MCFKSFSSSSAKTLIFFWMFSSLFDLTLGGCSPEASSVCLDIGSEDDHKNALTSAFSENHKIDLIFIVCNTTECTIAYGKVISFIVNLVALISTKYESYIDSVRLHIAMIVYDNTSVRVTLNDIKELKPLVGNCEFDRFPNTSMVSTEAKGTRYDGLLTDSLKAANTIFSQSARPESKKILWLFSDCGNCEAAAADASRDKRQEIKTAAGDIKRGYGDKVVVFTAGVAQCDVGWFATYAQAETMKSIATTNSSHYACIDEWIKFTDTEVNSDTVPQHWSDISKGVNIGTSCRECVNSSSSSYRCACQVSSKQYTCHEFPIDSTTLAIALGVGIGGGLLVVVIIVIIVVVVVRRCKRPSSPPPPLPRIRDPRPPASPPPPISNEPTYNNTEDDLDVEYEVMELERSMPGWSAHLSQLKREHPGFLHLGVYSLDGNYFAQTPGFTLTQSQTTALDDAMTNVNSGGKPRGKKADVIVGGTTYVIESKTRDKLSAKAKGGTTRLGVVCGGVYLVVGVVETEGRDQCDALIAEVLRQVTV